MKKLLIGLTGILVSSTSWAATIHGTWDVVANFVCGEQTHGTLVIYDDGPNFSGQMTGCGETPTSITGGNYDASAHKITFTRTIPNVGVQTWVGYWGNEGFSGNWNGMGSNGPWSATWVHGAEK